MHVYYMVNYRDVCACACVCVCTCVRACVCMRAYLSILKLLFEVFDIPFS